MRSWRLLQRQQQHLNSQIQEEKEVQKPVITIEQNNTVHITKKSLRVNSHSFRALGFMLHVTCFKNYP